MAKPYSWQAAKGDRLRFDVPAMSCPCGKRSQTLVSNVLTPVRAGPPNVASKGHAKYNYFMFTYAYCQNTSDQLECAPQLTSTLIGRFSVDGRPETTAVPFSPADRLDSWKSVAAHLHRGIRTVQRWEEFQGLPVHRLQHSKQGSIYAYKSEIDSWSISRQPVASRLKPPQSKRISQSTAGIKSRYLRTAIYALLGFAVVLSGFSLVRFFLSRPYAQVAHSITVKPVAIAVFPFQDPSSNSQTSTLAQTFTIFLIKDLQRSQSIHVINAEPVAHAARDLNSLQHIANVLHADEAVEGSIRREGDHIHITAQLVDSATGSVVWTAQFERKSPDTPAVQDRVAYAVAVEIENASP
ncbi:MAG TPA: hypothetical protein VGR93_01715 [Candidatus Acidoferrales bacterium]|nr:hypothetical protein [Candidatus Acidoferrales bacterium]